MGIVRRHRFLTLVFVTASLPVVALLGLEAAQHTGACKAWRAEVDARAALRDEPPPWDEFYRGDMSWDEYYGGVRDHVAHEMSDTRPLFCE